jgi:hypothetical protein
MRPASWGNVWRNAIVPVSSERYESAQQASVTTSSSVEFNRRASVGSAGLTCGDNERQPSDQRGCRAHRDTHLLESGLRLSAAEVGQGPGGVAQHGDAVRLAHGCSRHARHAESAAERELHTADSVPSSDCSAPLERTRSRQAGESPAMFPSAHTAWMCGLAAGSRARPPRRPHLLADIRERRLEQADEKGHGASVHDDLRVSGGARGDVGQRPGSLELHSGPCQSHEAPRCRARQACSVAWPL